MLIPEVPIPRFQDLKKTGMIVGYSKWTTCIAATPIGPIHTRLAFAVRWQRQSDMAGGVLSTRRHPSALPRETEAVDGDYDASGFLGRGTDVWRR
jgi:hypothetical protein